mmetsp:Transcript_3103/g.13977  ORF Transcript_3103/g.13977 Transcript_3103/m.13977 type:complete len:259 (+) Transcript_3103:222-998(+)
MFKKLFGSKGSGGGGGGGPATGGGGFGAPKTTPLGAVEKLKDTLAMLEKREMLLHKKMAAELEKAKDFNRAKNKRAALQCLKKKKLYEQQIEQLQNQQLKLEEQVITLEGSKTTAETFTALKSGAGAMKQLHKETNIDEVDKVMDDINEQTEKMRQVQDALGQPVGYAADLDEDELEEELAALEAEDLEDELDLDAELAAPAPKIAARPQPATAVSAPAMPSAPVGRAPAPKLPSVPGKSSEDEELEALQREMELLGA